MSERKVIAAHDEEGKVCWFRVSDAKHWRSKAPNDGTELFYVAGRWVVLPKMAFISASPAKIIDDLEALEWLTRNDYEPPPELKDYAESRQLL